MANLLLVVTLLMATLAMSFASAKKLHYVHWNKNNPMFRLDNTDHIVDINTGNLPWEYDQVNIICPVSKPGTKFPETHVIYSVSREEFDSCRITNPKPKIVAICNSPYRLSYFTVTFRSFTPTPGGLEFRPGQDYYFISTSSREDLHRRVGGGCATNNMKMIFKVADNEGNVEQHWADSDITDQSENEIFNGINDVTREEVNSIEVANDDLPFQGAGFYDIAGSGKRHTTEKPELEQYYNANVRQGLRRDVYYYHPKDLLERESANDDIFSNELSEVWRQRQSKEALKMRLTSSGSNTVTVGSLAALLPLAMALLMA